jgi:hypothetical protein
MQFMETISHINRLHQAQADYEKTLALVRALKEGSVKLDSVQMTADGWQIVEVVPAVEECVTQPN